MVVTLAPQSSGLKNGASAPTAANRIINFYEPQDVRNKTGLAYLLGITSQYVFEKGFMMGLSVNYGRTGAASSLEYASGTVVNQKFQASDTVNFSMKDRGYISELLQFGYAWQRFNPYLIFGLAQHRSKLQCPTAYNNTSEGIKKSYNTPVFGLGLNFAINKNLYLNIQWQRHFSRAKQWEAIPEIMPAGRLAAGTPKSQVGATMILMGFTYTTPIRSNL